MLVFTGVEEAAAVAGVEEADVVVAGVEQAMLLFELPKPRLMPEFSAPMPTRFPVIRHRSLLPRFAMPRLLLPRFAMPRLVVAEIRKSPRWESHVICAAHVEGTGVARS